MKIKNKKKTKKNLLKKIKSIFYKNKKNKIKEKEKKITDDMYPLW